MREFKLVEWLNPMYFHAYKTKRTIPMEAFLTLDINKKYIGFGLEFELKLVYEANFSKQVSNIQEIAEIIQKFETDQTQAERTKLLCLILNVPATSVSCK